MDSKVKPNENDGLGNFETLYEPLAWKPHKKSED